MVAKHMRRTAASKEIVQETKGSPAGNEDLLPPEDDTISDRCRGMEVLRH